MRQTLVVMAVMLGAVGSAAVVAQEVNSHLGHGAPAFEAGMTPATLGWGSDDEVYPDRFVVNPVDGAEMVWVPAAQFVMGSTKEEIEAVWQKNAWDEERLANITDEFPAHEVALTKGCWLYKHEVTVGQWAAYLAATETDPQEYWDELQALPNMPVVFVHWEAVQPYAEWAHGALPTEAQWEWAARGPEHRAFPWGADWDPTRCNSAEFWAQAPLPDELSLETWRRTVLGPPGTDFKVKTLAKHLGDVGRFPEGAAWCGALDLAGSVFEWCGDWYTDGYDTTLSSEDPVGPENGEWRILRGGAWNSFAGQCRSGYRYGEGPWGESYYSGFRLAVAP
ncbi:MAG: formylglycine-generating enzyme family protein [Armatimonadetes bacterium]|nr:formylglycine-generating enzyme family protein [Armatimonadota bacterium]